MVGDRRRRTALETSDGPAAVIETAGMEEGIGGDADDSFPESEVEKLRRCWELASVLNFLNVFEPIIGSDLKLTAEEIEMGLVEPDSSNARLHIALLKGIPPVNKSLINSGGWVTALCKKLAPWWPWIAEGEIPLTACKGEEVSKYRELDPTSRLRILKALCEIRVDQDDAVSFVNGNIKQGTEVSCFRKEKLVRNGNGASYWFDGDNIQGYRLYREVNQTEPKAKRKGNARLTSPPACFLWETIATNLAEFYKFSTELSSSKVSTEAAIGKMIKTDALPFVEKFQKKQERALKRKMRQEFSICISRNSINVTGIRSCRKRNPVSYTYSDYDKAIREAIGVTETMETLNEQRQKRKLEREKAKPNGVSGSSDKSDEGSKSAESETMNKKLKSPDSAVDRDGGNYDTRSDEEEKASDMGDSCVEEDANGNSRDLAETSVEQKPVETSLGNRLGEATTHPAAENRNVASKTRLRQRPIRNSALGSIVVPDSDDEI